MGRPVRPIRRPPISSASRKPPKRQPPSLDPPAPASGAGARAVIEAAAVAAGFGVTADHLDRLSQYVEMVAAWSDRLRLTGARSREDVARVLVARGFDVLPLVPHAGLLADLGSGAGVPGLLVALRYPDTHVTLVEAARRKAGFLEVAVRELALENVDIVAARAELLGRSPAHRERYDAVTARAVADLRVLVEYALPLLRAGGVALFPKGAAGARQLEAAQPALCRLGGVAELRPSSISPGATIILVRKTAPTPPDYPRRPGVAERHPIR